MRLYLAIKNSLLTFVVYSYVLTNSFAQENNNISDSNNNLKTISSPVKLNSSSAIPSNIKTNNSIQIKASQSSTQNLNSSSTNSQTNKIDKTISQNNPITKENIANNTENKNSASSANQNITNNNQANSINSSNNSNTTNNQNVNEKKSFDNNNNSPATKPVIANDLNVDQKILNPQDIQPLSKKPYKKPVQKKSRNNQKKLTTPKQKIIKVEPLIIPKKQFITESGRKISNDYFLQIIPKKSCDSLTKTECFRRDKKDEEPYFHKSIITIFDNRIIAQQHFNDNNPAKKIFLKVNNGDYQLTTTNDNLISFTVNNGMVSDLILVSGNLNRETILASKCVMAEKYYGFYTAYNLAPKISESFYFNNKNNFEGIRKIVLFSKIENIADLTLEDLYAVEVRAYNDIIPIENINLCKKTNINILEERIVSKADCQKRQECLILLNSNPDFNTKIIDESCLGYFDSKKEDFQYCSIQDNCQDYAIIKNCDVKFITEE